MPCIKPGLNDAQVMRRRFLAVAEVYADVAGMPYDVGSNEFAVVATKAPE